MCCTVVFITSCNSSSQSYNGVNHERLLNKTQEEILKYKDDPQSFEPIKTELLGNIVKLIGRVTKNQMFDRLEFITQLVFPNPDPEQEINKLESEKPAETKPEVENIQ